MAGNEPLFARTIFESLALRYASALANLEKMLGRKLDRIHMIGGATRNKLLIELTEKQTGLKVEIGETESSTVGSLAIQLAASEAVGKRRNAGSDPQVGRGVVPRQGLLGRFFPRFREVLPISFGVFEDSSCYLIVGGLLERNSAQILLIKADYLGAWIGHENR